MALKKADATAVSRQIQGFVPDKGDSLVTNDPVSKRVWANNTDKTKQDWHREDIDKRVEFKFDKDNSNHVSRVQNAMANGGAGLWIMGNGNAGLSLGHESKAKASEAVEKGKRMAVKRGVDPETGEKIVRPSRKKAAAAGPEKKPKKAATKKAVAAPAAAPEKKMTVAEREKAMWEKSQAVAKRIKAEREAAERRKNNGL
jgi:hypothetical protein